MANKKPTESYYKAKEDKTFNESLLDEHIFLALTTENIIETMEAKPNCTIYEFINNTSSYVFNLLFGNHIIPHYRIPHIINSPLNKSERIRLQLALENKMFINQQGNHCNKNENCTPLDVLFFIDDDSSTSSPIERLFYSFAYLYERNLTFEEKECIRIMYEAHKKPCDKNFTFPQKKYIIDNATQRLNKITREYAEAHLKKHNFSVLFDLLLDTALPEITTTCIRRFFLYATSNTTTYSALIKSCLIMDGSDKYQSFIAREADTLRSHISKYIHNNDDEKQFYQKQRGFQHVHQQNTLPKYGKEEYGLIYLLYGRRKLKKSSVDIEFSQEEIDDLHNILDNKLAEKLPCNMNVNELRMCYKNYVNYILNQSPAPLTKSLTEVSKQLIDFHKIIDNFFTKEYENDWYNKTSIFYSPWDFTQTAAYAWQRILKEHPHLSSNDVKIMQGLYTNYCKNISVLPFPKTQLVLLENPDFFMAYTESPFWLENAENLDYTIQSISYISSYTLRYICNIKDEAFSHKIEDLFDLDEFLRKNYTYTPPKEKATPEMLADFLDFYLPKKTPKNEETTK